MLVLTQLKLLGNISGGTPRVMFFFFLGGFADQKEKHISACLSMEGGGRWKGIFSYRTSYHIINDMSSNLSAHVHVVVS